jgi:predicted KAP-like P-loop ATPase
VIVEVGCPYKGLASFEDSDRDVQFFFGREREREIICANLMASKLTVLYGDTGVGKSSVLRAGVARELRSREEPLGVVVFDAWKDDPAAGLREALAAAAEIDPRATLADTLETSTSSSTASRSTSSITKARKARARSSRSFLTRSSSPA